MVVSVVCRKCRKELKIKKVSTKDDTIVISVEDCKEPDCSDRVNQDFAKYLQGILLECKQDSLIL